MRLQQQQVLSNQLLPLQLVLKVKKDKLLSRKQKQVSKNLKLLMLHSAICSNSQKLLLLEKPLMKRWESKRLKQRKRQKQLLLLRKKDKKELSSWTKRQMPKSKKRKRDSVQLIWPRERCLPSNTKTKWSKMISEMEKKTGNQTSTLSPNKKPSKITQ